jgi:hypothetical protein
LRSDVLTTLFAVCLLGFLALVVAACLLTPLVLRARERRQLYGLLATAHEKGVAAPEALLSTLAAPRPRAGQDRRRGVLLIGLAAGLMLSGVVAFGVVSLSGEDWGMALGLAVAGLGAVPGAVGVALLALARQDRGEAG